MLLNSSPIYRRSKTFRKPAICRIEFCHFMLHFCSVGCPLFAVLYLILYNFLIFEKRNEILRV